MTGDTNGFDDLFVRDTVANTTTLASRALFLAQVAGPTYTGAISDDGNMVAFSTAALVQSLSGDTTDNGKIDVYLRHYRTPTITSVSPSSLPRGAATNVTITGTGFEAEAVPSMEGGLVVGKIVVVSDTKVTARVRVPAGFAKGKTVIRVKNPGPSWNADNGATAECTDCVKIT